MKKPEYMYIGASCLVNPVLAYGLTGTCGTTATSVFCSYIALGA